MVMSLLLLGALMCYQVGFQHGVFAFVILGIVLELSFWLGIYKWRNAKPDV